MGKRKHHAFQANETPYVLEVKYGNKQIVHDLKEGIRMCDHGLSVMQ